MKKIAVSILAIIAFSLNSFAQTKQEKKEKNSKQNKIEKMTNKQMVLTATKELFSGDQTALNRYWGGNPYIQHNAGIPDGIDVLKPMIGMTKNWKTYRIFGEGNLVVSQSRVEGWGPKPMIVFDIFLCKDGKMIEHWDCIQEEENKTVSGRTQLDGSTEIKDFDKTAANKEIVQNFFDDVLYGHKMDKLTDYISTETYDQHNPGVGDGLVGFGEAMKKLAQAGLKMEYNKTYRIIADGNFVFTHSEGEFAGRHVAFADLFRIENGKIVEHWDTIQDVAPADKSANKNGMFEQVTK